MEAEQIFEVVSKLVGPIEPQGESRADVERLENMKKFIQVFEKMHQQIDNISYEYRDRNEHSMKLIGQLCSDHLDKMGIEE